MMMRPLKIILSKFMFDYCGMLLLPFLFANHLHTHTHKHTHVEVKKNNVLFMKRLRSEFNFNKPANRTMETERNSSYSCTNLNNNIYALPSLCCYAMLRRKRERERESCEESDISSLLSYLVRLLARLAWFINEWMKKKSSRHKRKRRRIHTQLSFFLLLHA